MDAREIYYDPFVRRRNRRATWAARDAARAALQLLYVRVDQQMLVARRFAWAREAAVRLPREVLVLILALSG